MFNLPNSFYNVPNRYALEEARYGYDQEPPPWNKWDMLLIVRFLLQNGASPSINQPGNSALACVLRQVKVAVVVIVGNFPPTRVRAIFHLSPHQISPPQSLPINHNLHFYNNYQNNITLLQKMRHLHYLTFSLSHNMYQIFLHTRVRNIFHLPPHQISPPQSPPISHNLHSCIGFQNDITPKN